VEISSLSFFFFLTFFLFYFDFKINYVNFEPKEPKRTKINVVNFEPKRNKNDCAIEFMSLGQDSNAVLALIEKYYMSGFHNDEEASSFWFKINYVNFEIKVKKETKISGEVFIFYSFQGLGFAFVFKINYVVQNSQSEF